MKKWQIITISAVALAVALVVGGTSFYKYYIVPKYLEPVVDRVSEYFNEEDVIEDLYSQAERLHEDGILDDETYVDFIQAYKKHNINSEEIAKSILEERDSEDTSGADDGNSSVSTRYASNKIGVEIIQTNDDENSGKASTRYSSERTSDRVKAEDIVAAEKVISEEEGITTEAPAETEVQTAYSKLKNNMTSDEFSLFVSIMNKLDISALNSYVSGSTIDKAGLKEYLHSRLSDSEYSQIINLGYKYAYVFIDD